MLGGHFSRDFAGRNRDGLTVHHVARAGIADLSEQFYGRVSGPCFLQWKGKVRRVIETPGVPFDFRHAEIFRGGLNPPACHFQTA